MLRPNLFCRLDSRGQVCGILKLSFSKLFRSYRSNYRKLEMFRGGKISCMTYIFIYQRKSFVVLNQHVIKVLE